MKKIILLVITALMMAGCDTRTEEEKYKDYLQKQKELKKQVEYQTRWKGYDTIVVDNCEYITKTINYNKGFHDATQSGYLAHKGNCRFCKERRQKEMEQLVEQIKEK